MACSVSKIHDCIQVYQPQTLRHFYVYECTCKYEVKPGSDSAPTRFR